jgi:hypothetical protein
MERKSLKRVIAAHEHIVPDATWDASLLELKSMVEQLEAYFLGSLHEFTIPLDPLGSEFQLKVWNVLRTIPYAQTRTYGQIALAVGQPKASRAVGSPMRQPHRGGRALPSRDRRQRQPDRLRRRPAAQALAARPRSVTADQSDAPASVRGVAASTVASRPRPPDRARRRGS